METGTPPPAGSDRRSLFLEIARIGVELGFDRPLAEVALDPAYERFVGGAGLDVKIECEFSDDPISPPKGAVKLFDSQGLWTLYETADGPVFVLEATDYGVGPYRIASFDRDLTSGRISSRPFGRNAVETDLMPDPLEYPLGEALTVSLLCKAPALMIHACGLSLDGKGILLSGHSGSGKSTIARLVGEEAIVLNDDRVIVRMEDGKPRMYGTPWHGDHPGVDPMGVDLAKLLFIEHADSGRVEPTGGVSAAAMLIARSFPPAWSREKMDRCLETASEIVEATPCFRMGFTPTDDILALVAGAR